MLNWIVLGGVVFLILAAVVGKVLLIIFKEDGYRGLAAGPDTPTAGRIRSIWNVTDRYL